MSEQLRVLIVDDNQMMAKTLQDILRVKGYQAEVAYSGPEALNKVEIIPFDCILSDIKMPDVNGVDLFRAIKTKHPDLPVVLMTAYATDNLIEEGLEEGVIAVLTKPLDMSLLLNFFSFLSRERSIVIVDDDPKFCQTLGDILDARGFDVHQMTRPVGIVEQLYGNGQVVLLDMKLKESDGLDVLREIKATYPNLPVILVTGYKEEAAESIETALKLSAYTYFYKPLQVDELLKTLNKIHHQELGRVLGRPVVK
jgi:DNA-binding NtrC family response regulator